LCCEKQFLVIETLKMHFVIKIKQTQIQDLSVNGLIFNQVAKKNLLLKRLNNGKVSLIIWVNLSFFLPNLLKKCLTAKKCASNNICS